MKRIMVCRYYIGVHVIGLGLFAFPMIGISIYMFSKGVDATFELVFSIIGTSAALYLFLFDFPGGVFSLDEERITMRVGLKKRSFFWHEIVECGLIEASAGGRTRIPIVYFSSRYLTGNDQEVFLKKTRRDLDHIAFFEPSEKYLKEIYPLLPSCFSEYLKNRARQIGMA